MRGKCFYSLLVVAVCTCFAGIAGAEMNASLETSFMSKYMWHGFEWYGDKTATSADFKVEIDDTGLYFGTEYITPNGSGEMNASYFDNYMYLPGSITDRAKFIYYAGYMFSLFDLEAIKTDLDLRYMYHDYYKISSEVLDQQEFCIKAQWRDLLPGGLTPYYQATYLSDGQGGRSMYSASIPPNPFDPPIYGNDLNANISGWIHKVGLAYDMPLYIPEIGMQNLRLSVDTVYNEAFDTSAAEFDAGIDMGAGSEWTHITYGAETDLDLGFGNMGVGVYYQHAMADDYTNLNNTFYSTVSYKMEF